MMANKFPPSYELTRRRVQDNKNTNAKSTQPVAFCQTGAHVERGHLVNSFAYQLQLRRLKDRHEKRRQLVCDYAMRIFAS